MELALNIGLTLVAIIMLWKGADWFVESASKIAARLGVSDLIIGLTVVAFGTSAPEFAVSIGAALSDNPTISLGNVIGSNIFNLGIILGIGALIYPLPVTPKRIVYRDSFLLIFGALFLCSMVVDLQSMISGDLHGVLSTPGEVSTTEGLMLFSILIAYLVYLFVLREPVSGEEEHFEKATAKDFGIFLVGLAAIILGGHVLVLAVSDLAREFGISEWLISVTVVAAGTSAPEVATTLTAIIKKRANMAIGNLLGSDLFNLLGVVGVAAMLNGGMAVEPTSYLNIALVAGTVILLSILMRIGWVISRIDGAILLSVALARWYVDVNGITLAYIF